MKAKIKVRIKINAKNKIETIKTEIESKNEFETKSE